MGPLLWPTKWAPPQSIQWQNGKENFHSRAGRVILEHETLFLKVYGLPEGEDTFETEQEAKRLINDVAAYRSGLQTAGIKTPTSRDVAIEQNGGKDYLVYLLDSHEGTSLQAILDRAGWSQIEVWHRRVAKLIQKIFATGANGKIAFGIDPKPSNFVANGQGDLAYVDLVWPLNPSAIKTIHPEIKPAWNFRYFSKAGVCLNWLIQFARQNVGQYTILLKHIASTMQANDKSQDDFQSLPGIEPLHAGLSKLRAGEVPDWNVDLLRILAIQLAAETGLGDEFLKKAFSLSRTNPHEPLPTDQLQACRKLILQHA